MSIENTIPIVEGSEESKIVRGVSIEKIVPFLSTVANQLSSFKHNEITSVRIMADASNSGVVHVDVYKDPVAGRSWPLLAGKEVDWPMRDLFDLRILIVSSGDKAYVIMER